MNYKILILISIFNVTIFCSNNIVKAVKKNNINAIKEITESNTSLIKRSDFEKALYLAAYHGNKDIFRLIAPYASKTAHRKAYLILREKDPSIDNDFVTIEIN